MRWPAWAVLVTTTLPRAVARETVLKERAGVAKRRVAIRAMTLGVAAVRLWKMRGALRVRDTMPRTGTRGVSWMALKEAVRVAERRVAIRAMTLGATAVRLGKMRDTMPRTGPGGVAWMALKERAAIAIQAMTLGSVAVRLYVMRHVHVARACHRRNRCKMRSTAAE
jgi:hypothetical protein